MEFNYDLLFSFFGIPFLYMLIIYFTSPYKTISLKEGAKAIMLGFVSITLLHFMYIIFPPSDWGELSKFEKYFYVVGTREELAKFIAFFILMKWGIKGEQHPIAYMFYSAMVGLGFAIEENIVYMQRYGTAVLEIRNFTSVLAHMFFGMFAGYWYGLGKLNTGKYDARSVFGVVMKKWPKTKQFIYSAIGVGSAAMYHGLWNYNLSTSMFARDSIMILMIILGFVTSKLLANNLISGYRNKLKTKDVKELAEDNME
jgi:RsiW-degrading membrane proteinase PrsW (M82 family)